MHAPHRFFDTGATAGSVVHRLPAEVKLVAAVVFVSVVACTPRSASPAVYLAPGLAMAAVAAGARIPIRFVLGRLVVALPFLTTALVVPFVAGGPRTTVAGVTMSAPGLAAGAAIGAKTVIGVLTAVVLSGTTATAELVAALGRLGLPGRLVAIAGFMIRYLDLLVDELGRRRIAMAARCYRPRWLGQAGPVATTMGTMFVRSYERGERVHAAMLSRGWTGSMPVPAVVRPRLHHWLSVAPLPLVALGAAAGPWLLSR